MRKHNAHPPLAQTNIEPVHGPLNHHIVLLKEGCGEVVPASISFGLSLFEFTFFRHSKCCSLFLGHQST